ncbi:MAG TPA: dihydrodipicolinate synthase family protein [Candidatus Corynebacterium avicola]|uniref:Dihydrodipicolinate synthase family protein n=1 Tax=Candidatus Corynebacterium avicola TaxID=2838527 RepID=A0A9D1RSQ3_9CORY|nr:dihydrodipicolinate synthase family protein [Candidatus Corynebacterium avicola]
MFTLPPGIMQAPVTPFTKDFEVDYDTVEKLVNFHTETPGNTGILALYNKAEPHSLTIEERKKIAEVTIKAVDGRLPTIIHVGHPSTDVVVELSKHAESIGADGIVAITPYYWATTQDEIYAHFARVFSSVDIAVMAYNNPGGTEAGAVSPDVYLRLMERFPNFVGMKDVSFAMDTFTEYSRALQEARPGFSIMTGLEWLAGSVPVGNIGSFGSGGAVAPKLTYDLWDALQEERWDDAYPLQLRVAELIRHIKYQYPSSVKVAMELMGRPVGPCRPPLPSGDEDTRRRMEHVLNEFNIPETEKYGW